MNKQSTTLRRSQLLVNLTSFFSSVSRPRQEFHFEHYLQFWVLLSVSVGFLSGVQHMDSDWQERLHTREDELQRHSEAAAALATKEHDAELEDAEQRAKRREQKLQVRRVVLCSVLSAKFLFSYDGTTRINSHPQRRNWRILEQSLLVLRKKSRTFRRRSTKVLSELAS